MKAKLSALEWLMVAVLVAVIFLGIMLLFHTLWTWVVPYFWAAGPEEIIRPGYWMFVGAWGLIAWVLRMLGIKR